MKLIEIIKQRIDLINRLQEEEKDKQIKLSNSNKVYSNDFDVLSKFISSIKLVEDIRKIDTKEVSSILSKYNKKYNVEELEKELKIIKVTYKAKYDNHLKVKLENSQVKFLNTFLDDAENILLNIEKRVTDNKNRLIEYKNRIEIRDKEIIRFNELLKKIETEKEILDEKDFNLINKIVNDESLSYELKKNLLIEFRNYNISVYNKSKVKEETITEKPVIQDDNSVKGLFEEFGYSNTMFKYINKYKKEIAKSMNVDEARKILQFLKDNNIIKRFSEADLLAICTYGTLTSVTNMYERLKKDNNHMYSVFFESPTIWVDEMKKGKKTRRKNNGKGQEKETVGILKTSVMKASYEDMLLNAKFFSDNDYDISIKTGKNKLALTTPHKKVVENHEAFKKYGIYRHTKDVSSIFSYSNVTEKLDRFVELGLLNGYIGTYNSNNYIKYNPSFILSATESHYAYLYNLRETVEPYMYYHQVFSETRDGEIKNEIKKSTELKKKLFGTTKDFIDSKFVDTSKYIRNYNYYEELMEKSENNSIDPDIFSTPEIMELENSYRIKGNEYVYVIGGLTFSRLKVLRNYSILRRYSTEIYEDTFIYALTRGSYLSEEAFRRVSEEVLFTASELGGNNGLLKSL